MCAHFTCGSLYCLDMAAKEAAEVARRCEDAKVSKELLLDRCGLRKFPDAIFFLLKHIGIAKVDLSRNELVRIPSKFGMVFSSVAVLDFSYNNLTFLPDECSQLGKLISINLSHNKIQEFPDILARLPALTIANLSHNEMSYINMESFDNVQSVEEINLLDNPLSEEVRQLLKSIVRFKIII